MPNYKQLAAEARKEVLKMVHRAGTSHIGSNYSCIDLLTILFEKIDLSKDKIIFSKGWVAASAYYFLAQKGIIPKEDLDTYCQPGSKYIGLVEPSIKGIEFAGGSMGFGLPAGVGFTLAKKLKGEDGKVYVLMSDGEQAIGTTWESALLAKHHNLDNLIVIVDCNGFQAMGKVEEVLSIEPLVDKWKAFGWQVLQIQGHDFEDIESVFDLIPKRPLVILAKTVKGKGVSFMENKLEWHYKNVNKEDYDKALIELNA